MVKRVGKVSTFDVIDEATRLDVPHGWIQWKGTDVCMDVHCACGAHLHLDAEFLYHLECPHCHRVYGVGPYVKLVELTEPELIGFARGNCCKTVEPEEDDF